MSATGVTSGGANSDRVQFVRFDNDSVCVTLSEEEVPLYRMEVQTADLASGPYRSAGSNSRGFVFVDDVGYQGTYFKVRISLAGDSKWTEFKPKFVEPLGDAGYVTAVADSFVGKTYDGGDSAVDVTLTPPVSLPIGGYLNFTYKEADSEGGYRVAATSSAQERTLAGEPVTATLDGLKPDTDYVFQIRLMSFETGTQVLAFSPVTYHTAAIDTKTTERIARLLNPEIVSRPTPSQEYFYNRVR